MRSENKYPCAKCEGDERQPDSKCTGCGKPFFADDMQADSNDDLYCDACYDDLPWFTDCCGYEAKGIDIDYGICRDCGDHCEYVK
jgi:hypothetical protein